MQERERERLKKIKENKGSFRLPNGQSFGLTTMEEEREVVIYLDTSALCATVEEWKLRTQVWEWERNKKETRQWIIYLFNGFH